ncbi:MAG TPA: hypothetical protein VIK56_06105, partial [Rhodoferax sp.]
SKFYSLGFLIGVVVQHPYFGKGSIVRVGKFSDSCTIKFDPCGIRVSMLVGVLLDANSDWQLDLKQLEKIYTTFSYNVDTRIIERDELNERLSQLESEMKTLDTRGTLADGSITPKKSDIPRKGKVKTLPTP